MLELICLVLATYRLATDFANEYGPFGIYYAIRKKVKSFVEEKVDETDLEIFDHPYGWLYLGIDCPICLSFWIAFAVYWLPTFIVVPLACAGAVSIYYDLTKRFGR